MSVNQLKEELASLGMSPVGNKGVLVQRLQEAQSSANPFVESPKAQSASPGRRKTPSKTPVKHKEQPLSKPSPNMARTKMASADIGFMTSPITTMMLAIRSALSLGKDGVGIARNSPLLMTNLAVLVSLTTTLCMFDGPHQAYLEPLRSAFMWYGRWIVLGILSSVGLGTGAHTFLLFLGPFIARVTTAAYICKSTDFPLYGPNSLLCPTEPYEKVTVTLLSILNKIKWEAFSWGLGTAIGELPPYLVARACTIITPD
jgi:hypothetical protein